MVASKRDVRPRRYAYFFLNGELYKTRRIEKRNNMIYAYDVEHNMKGFLWSDVRALGERAYQIGEVAEMLGCSQSVIRIYIREGKVAKPKRWYHDLTKPNGQRRFTPGNVRELREAMAEVNMGRPRKDGMIIPKASLPSADELEAKLQEQDVLYEKIGDVFVPVWKAKF